ncbi:hypothetical protein DN069_29440 [Streptacidiphilus pinicola]|uniref:Bulb-type lectin domain-containing protein n=2 Tax=Streptacidiphilus pinicola TaxID=2219663 RepID=A0A2X0IAX0_9ACTN|nr:hypothetical protein DN069_29440 [Streptacidiphilus pinicola]
MDTSGGMTVVGISSGTLGSQGNYAATSLNPSGTWQASGTGAFTYSYPLTVPSAVGGNAPSVAFSYDSQSVDGETSARNSQASWIGDGWDYQPGFVERSYRSCSSLLNSSGQRLLKGSGDECWGGDNAVISFGSHSGVLVPTTKDTSVPGIVAQWKLQNDDGTIVQELSGAQNNLYQGIYYRVVTTDGSAAYFGSDHAPATTAINSAAQSGKPADASTDSAWGVPVLHPVSGDPCYNSSDGTASKCSANEGWRWNLDFVVSPTGFVQRYDYSTESNYYDLGGGQVAASNGSGTLTPYTRGGTLTQISYGYQLADELAGHTPAAAVVFTSKQRCQTSPSFNCSQTISDSNASNWPDVPFDLACESGDSTTLPPGSTSVPSGVCITNSPTFWTATRLDSVTTKVHVVDSTTKTDKGLVAVDGYQLGQVYSTFGGTIDPVTGTTVDPSDAGSLQGVLWLQSIQHTGEADSYDGGGTAVTMNPVTFVGTEIDNRVDGGSAPELFRPRMAAIVTETGEVISVDYYPPDCSRVNNTMPASPDNDAMSCYQSYWSQPGASYPSADWFNKTRVQSVVVSDVTGAKNDTAGTSGNLGFSGSPDQVTNYSYSKPAWHRDDSPLTDDLYRTWDQFRGYHTVTATSGTAPDPITQTTTTYLQGMDGDYLASGTQRSIQVPDTVGDNVTDSNWLAGTPLETDTYTAAGGSVDAKTVTPAPSLTQTDSAAQTAWTDWNSTDYTGTPPTLSTLPALTAHRITDSTSRSYSLLKNGTWRENLQHTTYDSQGRPSTVDATADVGAGDAQEQCTTTSYATAPSGNPQMLIYPDQTTTVTGACGGTSPTLLSAKKVYYGGDSTLTNLGTFGQLDSTGRATGNQVATAASGGTPTAWRTTTAITYDGVGRVTQALDTNGSATHTTYTPADGSTNPTTVVSTNPQGWTTTSTLDPLRGVATENVDANKRKTDITYDALGRRTAVWLPGRSQASQSADKTFAYSIDPGATVTVGPNVATTITGAPSAVTTNTLREGGSYGQSITLYDGMLQPRQTQTTTADNSAGRLISDTFYDSHGWPLRTYAPYIDTTTAPSTTVAQVLPESQIPSETLNTYDGQGRTLKSTLYTMGAAQWSSGASYPGADETDTTPPVGGPTTQTITNALGQTTSTTVQNTNQVVKLTPGMVIPSGTQLLSASSRLVMQNDGNLVLYSLATGKSMWASSTSGNSGAYAAFATDGNLHVYNTSGTSLWSASLTAGAGTTLQLQNDDNLVLYNSSGAATWSSNSWHANPGGSNTTSYTYTPVGEVSTIQDSAGNTWKYQYNLLGQKISQSDPNTGTTTFDSYDPLGNLLATTDPRGKQLSYIYDWDNRRTAEYDTTNAAPESTSSMLASWAYDITPSTADSPNPNAATLGYPTSSTRYVHNGSTTTSYTEQVTAYNSAYQATGTRTTIPATDGFPAPPGTTQGTSGTVSFESDATYTPDVGLLNSTNYGADGGLLPETVGYQYDLQGLLMSDGGTLTQSGGGTINAPYVDNTIYTPLGQLQQTNYGVYGLQLATTSAYDAATGRLTHSTVGWQAASTSAIDSTDYRYNQAGEITAVSDAQSNGGAVTGTDTQCYTYDSFQRLTTAWTDSQGISSAGAGGTGSCPSTNPTAAATLTAPQTNTVGGPAPYWQDYNYDLLGDRTGMVNHDPTGNALNNTTQTIAYPGTNATTSAAQPNQATSITSTNPSLGTTTTTPSYTDTSVNSAGVNAGNTMSRTISGPLTTGFTLSTGGKLCLDDSSGSTTPENKVQVYTCNSSASQQWTFAPDGTVQLTGKGVCLDTAGDATTQSTKVVIDTCDKTKSTQLWKPTPNGNLANLGTSNMCLADPAATATIGTQQILWACGSGGQTWTTPGASQTLASPQTFTYDAEGRTATVTDAGSTGAQTSSYIYDASGNLLEQTSNGTTILYLFGGTEQLTKIGTGVTGQRFYPGPDGTVVTRTTGGPTPGGTVIYQTGNKQGTATTTISSTTSTPTITRRYYDPYGNPRGTQPTNWPDNHGFLGKPTDTNTGLDLLGARNYDPSIGRFTSPDPVFEAGDPNQMGGYTYAADNPATGSDPTGLFDPDGPGVVDPLAPDTGKTNNSSGNTNNSSGDQGPTSDQRQVAAIGDTIFGTLSDTMRQENANVAADAVSNWWGGFEAKYLDVHHDAIQDVYDVQAAVGMAMITDGEGGAVAADDVMTMGRSLASKLAKALSRSDDAVPEATSAAGKAATDAAGGGTAATSDTPASTTPTDAAPSTPAKGSSSAGRDSTDCVGCKCSFSPDTPVLMADGATKAIGTLKVGDHVESADAKNGKEAGARTIQHIWINHDTDLLDVTIDDGTDQPSVIHTTANHPFWDDTTHTWVRADHLKAGHKLASTPGHHPTVLNTKTTLGAANRWNLTIQQLHTYYVVAGGVPILVHNACGPEGEHVVLGVGEHSDALAGALRNGGDAGAHTFNDSNFGDIGEGGIPEWMHGVMRAAGSPDTRLSITLDGLPGATPEEAFQNAYIRGVGAGLKGAVQGGYGTAWEMSVVGRNAYLNSVDSEFGRSWSSIQFYWRGAPVDVQEPDWAALRGLAGQ